jgi:hypothetical protein
MSAFIIPGGQGFLIRSLWAALATHDDGDEGVAAVLLPDGAWFPLVAADKVRLGWIRDHARRLSKASGIPIRIVRLTQRSDVEVFHPDGRHEDLGQ